MDFINEVFDESLDIHKQLFQSMDEGIILFKAIWDESGNFYDYFHLEVNPAFERILGISSVDIQGKTWREIQYFDFSWLELLGELVQTGNSFLLKEYFDIEQQRRFGLKAFSLGNGNFTVLFSEITDCTMMGKISNANRQELGNKPQVLLEGFNAGTLESRFQNPPQKNIYQQIFNLAPEIREYLQRADQAREEAERKAEKLEIALSSDRELLKVTLNSLDEGVATTDPENRIVVFNKAASALTGYSSNEAIGKPISRIFYFLNDITSEPVDVMADYPISQQLVLVNRDLREATVTVNRSSIQNDEGQIIGTVLVIEDITEKQKIGQEMLKTAKLESLAILAGGVAHDFNNILAGILANLQLAATKLKRHEDISKNLETTAGITRKASELTKQLLTFAKGGNPVRKSTSIIDLIQDTVHFILSGSKVKAEFNLPEDLWIVDIDEGQIAQVINNITINAKQAMPIGGVLQIYGENVTLDVTDQHISGKYVKLTLKDHGIGIPEGIIDKIFDPFFTTKKTGNGLGLSTSYSIIKKHNGYLEVESTPGIGTTFYIFLPASIQQLEVKKVKSEIVISDGIRILLMDDEETIRNVSGEMLSYFGYRVSLAKDGQETIRLYKEAKEKGEAFDVVIMDLTIPGGLGGMETMAVLRQIDPDIKAIITSGYANDQVVSDYRKYGFGGVVIKPYKVNELNEVLVKVIDQKQLPLGLVY